MIGRWALGKLLGRWSAIKVAYKKSVVVGLEEVGRGVEGCRTQQQQHMCTCIRTKPYIWEFAPESGLVRLGRCV